MTNNRTIMGDNTNSFWVNVLAIVTMLAPPAWDWC